MDITKLAPDAAGRSPYHLLEVDPSLYTRNYEQSVYKETLRRIHPKLKDYVNIVKLDLGQQKIGNDRLEDLCKVLKGSKLEYLNLSGNELSDKGMDTLSNIMRSLGQIRSLNLSYNHFTDRGIESFVHIDRYSPNLLELDLSYNILTKMSAYFIGYLFKPKYLTEIHTLRLGGSVAHHLWGDEFLQIFLCSLWENNRLKQLKALHLPEFGLTEEGFECLISFLCSRHNLSLLTISKNFIHSKAIKHALLLSLSINNPNLMKFFAIDCGLTFEETQSINTLSFENLQRNQLKLTWLERLQLAYFSLKSFYVSQEKVFYILQSTMNSWKLESPLRWQPPPKENDYVSLETFMKQLIPQEIIHRENFAQHIIHRCYMIDQELALLFQMNTLIKKEKDDLKVFAQHLPKRSQTLFIEQQAYFASIPLIKEYLNQISINEKKWTKDFKSFEQLLTYFQQLSQEVFTIFQTNEQIIKYYQRKRKTFNEIISIESQEIILFIVEDIFSHIIELGFFAHQLLAFKGEYKIISDISKQLPQIPANNTETSRKPRQHHYSSTKSDSSQASSVVSHYKPTLSESDLKELIHKQIPCLDLLGPMASAVFCENVGLTQIENEELK